MTGPRELRWEGSRPVPEKDPPHFLLLPLDGPGRVDYMETHLLRHGLVFLEDAALENAKAFLDVAAEIEVHPGFVILQSVASAEDAAESHVQRVRK